MAEGAAHRIRLAAEGNHLAGAAGGHILAEEADQSPVVEADRILAATDSPAVEGGSYLAVGRTRQIHHTAQVEELRTDPAEVRRSLDRLGER